MLEALGFIWVVDFSRGKYNKAKDNPHYQLLLVYSKAGNDVNGLKTSQNPVKTEDGWMIVNAPSDSEKKKSTGAWLRSKRLRNDGASCRKIVRKH
jgi:hypothetical protein